MKKTLSVLIILINTVFAQPAFAGTWKLQASQFSGGTWYCTYVLLGSNPPITQTITAKVGCQSILTDF
jgi:hypothetical protein